MSKIFNVRRFQNSDANEVSALIIKTLRTTNSKDYSSEYGKSATAGEARASTEEAHYNNSFRSPLS